MDGEQEEPHMEPFATPEDLSAYYRVMDADEWARAESLLSYATAIMRTFMGRHGVAVDEKDATQAEMLKGICCSVVKRAMEAGAAEGDVTAWGGVSVHSASGDVYLTSAERTGLLGASPRRCIGFLHPEFGGGT